MTEVRVRIAPSPTGSPHVGTAYIALFNYLFAKKNNGKFILRIEDTDQTRSHPVYEDAIMQALKWLGLSWDEGPDVGGEYGPYRQSERTEIYRQYVEKLLIKGGAYRCFCTAERLTKMREEQTERKLPVKYDGKCRQLSENIIAKKLKENVPYVVRLKVPKKGECTIQDRLRGTITYDYKQIDDQVLLKSDSFPTYHLANVVDDHLMKVTHVIRGEEWLPSTPKHILLYDFWGWDKPEFIHMPLLLNPDGSKLSKRKNPTSIFYYRDSGFLPEALLNYLCMMGYSRPNGEEKFSLEEMLQDFDISRITLGGSVFDLKKLGWLCGKYIRENYNPETLYRRLGNWRLNNQFLARVMPLMHTRMETLGDFMTHCAFFWSGELEYNVDLLISPKHNAEETAKALQAFLILFEEEPVWSKVTIEKKIHETATLLEWKIRDVTMILFVSITGKKVAPPLYESMELLGLDISRVRILNAINKLGGISKEKLEEFTKELEERKAKFLPNEKKDAPKPESCEQSAVNTKPEDSTQPENSKQENQPPADGGNTTNEK